MKLISRKEAIELGSKTYFSSKECPKKHGIPSIRYVSSKNCCQCAKESTTDWYHNKDHPHPKYEDVRLLALADNQLTFLSKINCKNGHSPTERRTSNNRCLQCETISSRLLESKDERKTWRHDYSQKPNRLEARKIERERRELTHPGYGAAKASKRRADKKDRTIDWADSAAISKIYENCSIISKELGIKHEVDHIVPLIGKQVSGLHVEYNLDIKPSRENRRKGNKFCEKDGIWLEAEYYTKGLDSSRC